MYAQTFMHILPTAYSTLVEAIKSAFARIFKAPMAAPGPATTPNLNNILLHLCDGNRELALYVQRWIALPLRNPHVRMERALWICGGQGAGKGLFFERLIAPLYAGEACTVRNELHEHFNDWALGKRLILADEFSGDRGAMMRIKQMMTADKLMIQRKAAERKLVRNRMNFIFMSGHVDALRADCADRRFVVIDAPPALPREVYQAAAAELASGAGDAYRNYLLHVLDMGGFNQHSAPPARSTQNNHAQVQA